MNETLEDLFVRIEKIIESSPSNLEELKEVKREYIRQHRYVLEYFNFVQNEMEEGTW